MRRLAVYKAFSRNCFTAIELVLFCVFCWSKNFEIYGNLLSVFSKICNENSTFGCIAFTKATWLNLLNVYRILNFYFFFLKGKQIIFYTKGCDSISGEAVWHFKGNSSFTIFVCNQNRFKEGCWSEVFSFILFFFISRGIPTFKILYTVSNRIHKEGT